MTHTELDEDQEALAALYVLGSLDGDEARAFERHLMDDDCAVCRAEVEAMHGVAGDLAIAPTPASPSPAVRSRLFARVAHDVRRPAAGEMGLVFTLASEGEWTERKPGVFTKELIAPRPGDRSRSYLVRMEPGTVLDQHVHEGVEHCYVISGSTIVHGRRMRAGDYSYAPRGSVHEPIPSDEGAVLFIVQTF